MTNQNVQTNRHGPQNKGCNQASPTMPIGLDGGNVGRSVCPAILKVYLWLVIGKEHQKQFWKRRVHTRNGDIVTVKLAYDIHTLMSVIEGGDYIQI